CGGLAPPSHPKRERVAAAIPRGDPVRPLTATDRLRAGTTLERTWRGETHVVSVLASRFAYRGQRYRSLSQIARLITGTRWNGPAFFGLRRGSGKAPAGSYDAPQAADPVVRGLYPQILRGGAGAGLQLARR